MEVTPFEVRHYVTIGGKRPFEEWLDSIRDKKTDVVITQRLLRLEAGNLGDFKSIGSILELRINYGPGYRIYCGKTKNTFVILLLGGTKRTQEKDIETAKTYWEDYQKRLSS